jgi:uncharacterized protein (DUF2384 family)
MQKRYLTLAKLNEVKPFIKIDALARAAGIPVATLRHRILRGSPELSQTESRAIAKALEHHGIQIDKISVKPDL